MLPRRRSYQFSLRTFLVLVTLVCVGFGWWVHWSREWISQRHEFLEVARHRQDIITWHSDEALLRESSRLAFGYLERKECGAFCAGKRRMLNWQRDSFQRLRLCVASLLLRRRTSLPHDFSPLPKCAITVNHSL